MVTKELEIGGLVRHRERPGVWRVVGLDMPDALIEPWDDAGAGLCHVAEAYEIKAPVRALSRLLPGRSSPAERAIAVATA